MFPIVNKYLGAFRSLKKLIENPNTITVDKVAFNNIFIFVTKIITIIIILDIVVKIKDFFFPILNSFLLNIYLDI